jgi:hypothetical protein
LGRTGGREKGGWQIEGAKGGSLALFPILSRLPPMADLLEFPNDSISQPASRMPSILLKVLALGWFLGGLACLGEVVEALGSEPFSELARRILIYLPIASLPVLIGIGLWRIRPWARRWALLLVWLILGLTAIVLLWAIIVESDIAFGLGLLLSMIGIPVVLIVTLQTYFLLHPATKALFKGQVPERDPVEPSLEKKKRRAAP